MYYNRFILPMVYAALLVIAATSISFAQAKGTGGWGVTEPFNKLYNQEKLDTITGKVLAVDELAPMKGMTNSFHLVVKTAKGNVSVFTAPLWFIQKLNVEILVKDEVEITGARAVCEENPIMIASVIVRGKERVMLRDDNGSPLWGPWLRFMMKQLN